MTWNKVILKVYFVIIRYVVGLQIKASSMFSFRWLIEVAISYWTAQVLTNMQTPFYAQYPTLISALENSKSAMAVYGKLIISVCCGVMFELAQGFRDSRTISSNCFRETIFNHSVFQRTGIVTETSIIS